MDGGHAAAGLGEVREAGGEGADGERPPGGLERILEGARARDGVVGVVVARDVELGDATSEVGVQDRAGGVVVAGANVAGEVTRDALRAVAAFLKDLVHEDVLPRLRRGDVREEHHGARRDRNCALRPVVEIRRADSTGDRTSGSGARASFEREGETRTFAGRLKGSVWVDAVDDVRVRAELRARDTPRRANSGPAPGNDVSYRWRERRAAVFRPPSIPRWGASAGCSRASHRGRPLPSTPARTLRRAAAAMLALRAPLVERVPSPRPFPRSFPPRRSPRLASGASVRPTGRHRVARRSAPHPADPTTGVPRSLFCFGLGYTSLGLVNVLKRAGWTVSGTCRDDSRAESLASAGIDAHVWRPDDHLRLDRDGVAALAAATHVLASVPPVADFDRDPVLTDARCVDVLARSENLRMARLPQQHGRLRRQTRRVGRRGRTRGTPLPEERRATRRRTRVVRAATRHTLPLKIFRLGGIYGPGGVYWTPAAKDAAAGEAIAAESRSQRARKSRGYTSRCHVADIVATICASVDAGDETEIGRVYNVADDEPAPRGEAAAFAAKLLGVASDRRRESDGEGDGGGGAERARGEKRVRNDRIKVELGVELLFPTYREGLAAIAEGNRTPFGRDGGERA